MTPQVKSLQGDNSCGFFFQHHQDMPAGLSCLYAVSPPLHQMLSEYSELQDNENLKSQPSRQTFRQNVAWSHKNGCQECDPDPDSVFKLESKSSFFSTGCPRKSCLKLKFSDNKGKSVTFADTKGFSLTDVKYVTEATEDPPPWEGLSEVCKSFENGMANLVLDPAESSGELLVADFDQPSADYLKFKEKLEKNSVCVENAMFNVRGVISGTVRVKNIRYEKTVFVRMTFDDWSSFHDYNASFVKSFSEYEACTYDTFQFSIPLPDTFDCTKQKAVFCVCYRTDGVEFWDNNDGRNYSAKAKVYTGHASNTISFRSRRFSLPNTYQELPTPEFKTWMDWEKRGPFY